MASTRGNSSRDVDTAMRHAHLKNEIPVPGCVHQAGTCQFVTDPLIGAVNPALTAMANALRMGDDLIERLGVRHSERETQHVV